jgi:uncharacterized integral membrane protein (TIGR00698 family)
MSSGSQIAPLPAVRTVLGACRARWPGLLLAGAVAGAGTVAAGLPWARGLGLSALTLSIVLGILAGNTFFPAIASVAAAGVDFSKNTLLRTGVVLYGFRLSFGQLAQIGWAGLAIDVLMITLVFTLSLQLGTRVFKLDRDTSLLIGVGSAICGAAAVLAAEPVVRAQPHRVSVAIATVVVFGTLGMFLYPVLYPHLGLSPQNYGIYAGSTIHEVAQVVAAGKAVSDSAAAAAVIEKMLRVMLLAPFLLLLSHTQGQGESHQRAGSTGAHSRLTIPWFAIAFVGVCAINSLGLLPPEIVEKLVNADTLLLATAMAALGLRTHAKAFREAGVRPLLLAGTLFCFLIVGGYAVNRLVMSLLA